MPQNFVIGAIIVIEGALAAYKRLHLHQYVTAKKEVSVTVTFKRTREPKQATQSTHGERTCRQQHQTRGRPKRAAASDKSKTHGFSGRGLNFQPAVMKKTRVVASLMATAT
jgi:hypothetical protein